MNKPYHLDPHCAPKVREWLAAGRKVAVWQNANLSSSDCGTLAFTPGDRPSPHWKYTDKPLEICERHEDFVVEVVQEIKRVKVRVTYAGLHRQDLKKVDRLVAEVGPSAFYNLEDDEAIIRVVVGTEQLTP